MYEQLVEKFWTCPEHKRMACRHCGETEHVRGRLGRGRVTAHVVLTLLTKGGWFLVWLADWLREKSRWACEECGKTRGPLARYDIDAAFDLPHTDRWHRAMAGIAAAMVIFAQWPSGELAPTGPGVDLATAPAAPSSEVAEKPTPAAPVAPTAPEVPPNPVVKKTSAEYLLEAQKELDSWDPNPDIFKKDRWGNLVLAEKLLDNIGEDAAEHQAAQKLRIEIGRRRADIEKVSAREAEKLVRDMRLEVASKLEEAFLKSGMDVTVHVEGKAKDVLRLKYILWSRPLIYKLTTELDILPGIWKSGYRKVVFDGHDTEWTYTAPEN